MVKVRELAARTDPEQVVAAAGRSILSFGETGWRLSPFLTIGFDGPDEVLILGGPECGHNLCRSFLRFDTTSIAASFSEQSVTTVHANSCE